MDKDSLVEAKKKEGEKEDGEKEIRQRWKSRLRISKRRRTRYRSSVCIYISLYKIYLYLAAVKINSNYAVDPHRLQQSCDVRS